MRHSTYAAPSPSLPVSVSVSLSEWRIALPRVELAALCNVTLRYVTFSAPLNAHDMCKTIAFSISFHFVSFLFSSLLFSSLPFSFRWQQQRPLTAKACNKINLTKRIEWKANMRQIKSKQAVARTLSPPPTPTHIRSLTLRSCHFSVCAFTLSFSILGFPPRFYTSPLFRPSFLLSLPPSSCINFALCSFGVFSHFFLLRFVVTLTLFLWRNCQLQRNINLQ